MHVYTVAFVCGSVCVHSARELLPCGKLSSLPFSGSHAGMKNPWGNVPHSDEDQDSDNPYD